MAILLPDFSTISLYRHALRGMCIGCGITHESNVMIRVLQIYKTYKTETVGGVEAVMHQLGSHAVRHGITPKVFTLSAQSEPTVITDGDVEVSRYPIDLDVASTPFSRKALQAFRSAAAEVDILHYHFPWPFGDVMHLLRRPKKPVVVTYHSDIVKQKHLMKLYAPLMHWFLRRANVIVATSPNYIASSPVLQRYRAKTVAIPIGIADTRATPDPEVLEGLKTRIGHRKFFAFVGVLRYYKGLHFLLEANVGADFPIVIAGAGPKEAELKAQAAALGLKNVVFLGAVSDAEKNALLALCYAFVFPSHLRSEAFGISLLEAAMHGKPMLSMEIGSGMSYINQDSETGLTLPAENTVALRAAMQRLWDNPEVADRMGTAARKRYEMLFTVETMAKSYADIYHSLMQ